MFDRITVSPEFRTRVPDFLGAYIDVRVTNSPTPPALVAEMEAECARIRTAFTTETLKSQAGIAATRAAYKACGKDPSRYRPAGEQLARRVVQGKPLNYVSTLVDLGNLVSLRCGYATGLLDADRIEGELVLGVGRADEVYEGIGRGKLNIDGLPVYRDALGGVATPTSDSTRTMTTDGTTHLLFIINAYDGNRGRAEKVVDFALDLLRGYAAAHDERVVFF